MGDVLCLAEGEGRNAVFLAATGRRVASVDLTEAGVAKTRRLAAAVGVPVDAVVGDLATFDLGVDRWDGVVSVFAHMPSGVRVEVHRRVWVASLRPGGVVLLEAYTPDQIGRGTGGPASPDLMMSVEGLKDADPLSSRHAEERQRSIVEGTLHTGIGSVVQVIARKKA